MRYFLERWAGAIVSAVPNILAAAIILLVSLYLARLASTLVDGAMHRRRVGANVGSLLSRALYWTIVTAGLLSAMGRFFDVTTFIAGLGIVGFTVGFALQDVMKNFAAGIILALQQPFRVGEAISVAGFDGSILAINLRATEMSTFDGRLVSIPNATILTSPITNFTRAARRRVDILLRLPAGMDVPGTRKRVLEAIRATGGVVDEPPPAVVLQELGDTTTELAASFWVDVSRVNPDAARDLVLTRLEPLLAARALPTAAQGEGGARPA